MLAKPADAIPQGEGWLFEPKWDGFRAIVFRDGDEVLTQSRDLKPLDRYSRSSRRRSANGCLAAAWSTGRWSSPESTARVRSAPGADPSAASRVAMLAEASPASFVAWDLLALDDTDLTARPQSERRDRLVDVLEGPAGRVHLTPATLDHATARDWFERFEGAGLDGVIAKRLDAPYQPGKRAMLKVKHQRTADCVVAGFRWHKLGEPIVGSLLLGLYDEEGELHHVGVSPRSPWSVGAARRRAGAPARGCARGPSMGKLGRLGGGGGRRGSSDARRPEPLEPGTRPVVGAAAGGAGGGGRLRPPAGRPVPARDHLPTLAS